MQYRILLAVAAILSGTFTAVADLHLWISYHYQGVDSYESGKYRDAESLLADAKEETCDPYRAALTLDALGMTCLARGKYAEAEEAFRKALCLRKEHCGEESRYVPTTLNNLADLHYVAGDKDKVEKWYRGALELNENDPYNVEVGRSLNGLALLAADAGDAAEAENLLKRAVRIHYMGGRSAHPYMATALTNLGILYTEQGRLKEAKDALRRSRHVQDQSLGHKHPDVAVRLHAEANLHLKLGHAKEAREAKERAESIQAKFAKLNEG